MLKIPLHMSTLEKGQERVDFMVQEYYGQENSERYVTPMVGAFQFVTQ